jgi:hypothetical protein
MECTLEGCASGYGNGDGDGDGMGRRCSWSPGENPHLHPQPHQQEDPQTGFKPVYRGVGYEGVHFPGNVRWGWGGRGVAVRERGSVLDFIRTSTSTRTHHSLVDSIIVSGMASIPLIQMLLPA